MKPYSLYAPDLWERFVAKHGTTEHAFELKKYPQFDPYFNFFKKSDKIKKLVSDSSLKKVAGHSFIPFVKILVKTPRYRYQEVINEYQLETKIRPISFASHFDTYLYGFYSFALTERYQAYIKDQGFSDCVLAYRTDLDGKCNIQFAKEVFDNVKKLASSQQSCTAIALDITGYFDNIEHSLLKDKWCKILDLPELPIDQYKIFRSLSKYSYSSKNSILNHFGVNLQKRKSKWATLLDLIPDSIAGPDFTNKMGVLRKRKLIVQNLPKKAKDGTISHRGIPQGSPVSALLSNIYLIDFDQWLYNLSVKYDFVYRRYCDDILVICKTHEVERLNKLILAKIEQYHLHIQSKKTDVIEFKIDLKGKLRAFNKKEIDEKGIILNCNNEQKYYKSLQYLGFEFNGTNIYIRPGSLSRYFRKVKARIVKTVMMAYSYKSKNDKIFKKQIYERYSHLGKRNFISYAINAASHSYPNSKGKIEGMNSISIRRQLSAHFSIIEQEVKKTSITQFKKKEDARLKRIAAGKKAKSVTFKS